MDQFYKKSKGIIPSINVNSNKQISFGLDNIVFIIFTLLIVSIVIFFILHVDYKINGRYSKFYDYTALFGGMNNYYSQNIKSKATELSEKKNKELTKYLDDIDADIDILQRKYTDYTNQVKNTNTILTANYQTEKEKLSEKFQEFSDKLSSVKKIMDNNVNKTRELEQTYKTRIKGYFNAMLTQLDNMNNIHIPAIEASGNDIIYKNLVNLYNSIYELLNSNLSFITSINKGFTLKHHKQKTMKNIEVPKIESVNKMF